MDFKKLIKEIKKVELHEIRTDLPEFFEFVLKKDHLGELTVLLEKYFGPPFKAPGEYASQKAQEYAGPYGGILQNQTLYCLENEKFFECVMLWPWGDGVLITVKLIQQDQRYR